MVTGEGEGEGDGEAELSELFARCDGNASEAARPANMDRAYLLTLLRTHRLR